MFIDPFGRAITYLRISLTDRCNLRCVYCMPQEGLQWQARASQLSAEEIVRVVESAARGGVTRVRLTGGEPLVHHQPRDRYLGQAAHPRRARVLAARAQRRRGARCA